MADRKLDRFEREREELRQKRRLEESLNSKPAPGSAEPILTSSENPAKSDSSDKADTAYPRAATELKSEPIVKKAVTRLELPDTFENIKPFNPVRELVFPLSVKKNNFKEKPKKNTSVAKPKPEKKRRRSVSAAPQAGLIFVAVLAVITTIGCMFGIWWLVGIMGAVILSFVIAGITVASVQAIKVSRENRNELSEKHGGAYEKGDVTSRTPKQKNRILRRGKVTLARIVSAEKEATLIASGYLFKYRLSYEYRDETNKLHSGKYSGFAPASTANIHIEKGNIPVCFIGKKSMPLILLPPKA